MNAVLFFGALLSIAIGIALFVDMPAAWRKILRFLWIPTIQIGLIWNSLNSGWFKRWPEAFYLLALTAVLEYVRDALKEAA